MGKLGGGALGLDKLKRNFTDGITEEDFKLQAPVSTTIAQNKSTNIQIDKSTVMPIKKVSGAMTVNANVPAEFKAEVGMYCAETGLKESELIFLSVSKVIGFQTHRGVIEMLSVPESTERVMLYGRFSVDFKTAAKIYEKANKITEANLVYSAVRAYMDGKLD